MQLRVSTARMESMKHRMEEIAERVARAIRNSEPIFIRHHADNDGIAGGIVIEQACRKLILKEGRKPEYLLYRMPSRTPYYHISDAFRDISFGNKLIDSRGRKSALIISIDNGSSPDDMLALKTLNSFGFEIIVIDHHNPIKVEDGKTRNCRFLSYHINPYLFGYEQDITAGMLSYEIAAILDPDIGFKIFPALSAVADRSECEEASRYISDSGLSYDELKKISLAVDFTAFNLRNDPATSVYLDLINNKDIYESVYSEVKKMIERCYEQIKKEVVMKKFDNGLTLAYFDVPDVYYPKSGILTGMAHIRMPAKNLVTLGFEDNRIVFRSSTEKVRSHDLMAFLKGKFSESSVEGGGHEMAAGIQFYNISKDEMIKAIEEFIGSA